MGEKIKKLIVRHLVILLTMVILAIVLLLRVYNVLSGVDNSLKDTVYGSKQFIYKVEKDINPNIIILGADDQSLQDIGRWPWDRSIFANLIDTISAGHPAAVFVDVIFAEETDPETDQLFADAVERAGNVIIPSYGNLTETVIVGKGIKAGEVYHPYEAMSNVCIRAHINTAPDADGVVRKTINQIHTEEEAIESVALQAYRMYQAYNGEEDLSEEFTKYEDYRKMSYIDYKGGPGEYAYVSLSEVLVGNVDPSYFEGAIVLIGPYSEGMQDFYYTPISKDQPTYGVEIWANIMQNLIDGDSKRELPYVDLLLVIIVGGVGAFLFKKLSPFIGGMLLIGFNFIYLMVTRWLYHQGVILAIVYLALEGLLLYLMIVLLRYIEEYRERKRVTHVFGKYVAPQVVSKILEEGEEGLKLGGSKRFVSVLFVDIRGFTPMSEKATPEEVVQILNEYLHLTATSIINHEGFLDKFIGDATMAIFNAPIELENHALHAVKAALDMKEGSIALEQKLIEKFGIGVKFGIGINTGYAVVGNIGCKFRMDYTGIGDTVNTAARLEANAKGGQILISQSTYDLVKEEVEVEALGEIKVKGKEIVIPIYGVLGLKNKGVNCNEHERRIH